MSEIYNEGEQQQQQLKRIKLVSLVYIYNSNILNFKSDALIIYYYAYRKLI
jgi:hypothetical protein